MDLNDYLLHQQLENIHFWYKARVNLIHNLLEYGFGGKGSERKLVVIGCGTGTEFTMIEKFGEITALDINEDAVEVVKNQGFKTILADIEKYDLKKDFYDGVCCFDVLEHLEDDALTIENIYQSLKKDGYLFITVPAFAFLFSTHDLAMRHKRRYHMKEISQKLQNAGFEILKLNYWNTLPFPLIALFRMLKRAWHLYAPLDSAQTEKEYRSEIRSVNKYLNKLGYLILNIENGKVWQSLPLPFGLTIYGVLKK